MTSPHFVMKTEGEYFEELLAPLKGAKITDVGVYETNDCGQQFWPYFVVHVKHPKGYILEAQIEFWCDPEGNGAGHIAGAEELIKALEEDKE